MTPVKNFWIKPSPVPVNAKKFSFGYTDSKEREYDVNVKGSDLKSFHDFVFALLAAKNKSLIPWSLKAVRDLKNKVEITNPNDEAVQMELPLKVAMRFVSESAGNNLS